MRKTIRKAALATALLLPLSALAQQLPNSGASDEALGKDSIIKLSATLSSHSEVRRVSFEDQVAVSAVRWNAGEGTVWVYRTNEMVTRTGYQHFAIRVHMRQIAPGQIELKSATFCDVGADRFRNISTDRCDALRNEFMPRLVAEHRQDFITFIGTENTTPAQAKAAATSIHDAVAGMIGLAPATDPRPNSGKTEQVPGQID